MQKELDKCVHSIHRLEGEKKVMAKEIEGKEAEVEKCLGNIGVLNAEIQRMGGEITTLTTRLETLSREHADCALKLSDSTTAIQTLESDSLTLHSTISSLESTIHTLKADNKDKDDRICTLERTGKEREGAHRQYREDMEARQHSLLLDRDGILDRYNRLCMDRHNDENRYLVNTLRIDSECKENIDRINIEWRERVHRLEMEIERCKRRDCRDYCGQTDRIEEVKIRYRECGVQTSGPSVEVLMKKSAALGMQIEDREKKIEGLKKEINDGEKIRKEICAKFKNHLHSSIEKKELLSKELMLAVQAGRDTLSSLLSNAQ